MICSSVYHRQILQHHVILSHPHLAMLPAHLATLPSRLQHLATPSALQYARLATRHPPLQHSLPACNTLQHQPPCNTPALQHGIRLAIQSVLHHRSTSLQHVRLATPSALQYNPSCITGPPCNTCCNALHREFFVFCSIRRVLTLLAARPCIPPTHPCGLQRCLDRLSAIFQPL